MYYVYSFIASLNLGFQTFWKGEYLHDMILWILLYNNTIIKTIKEIMFIIKVTFYVLQSVSYNTANLYCNFPNTDVRNYSIDLR